jgi:hypothetical protein
VADAAADAEVVGINHLAAGPDFLSFNANVGDPVLPAGIGATGNVETKFVLKVGETLFQLLGKPAGKGLCFRES